LVIFYEYHKVCPLVGIGTPPPPLPQASVPPGSKRGGGDIHSPAGVGVKSQFERLEKKFSTVYSVVTIERSKILLVSISSSMLVSLHVLMTTPSNLMPVSLTLSKEAKGSPQILLYSQIYRKHRNTFDKRKNRWVSTTALARLRR
jgi:hypothetical protein